MTVEITPDPAEPAMVLLFESGKRPSATDIRLALGNLPGASISFDPSGTDVERLQGEDIGSEGRRDWLEIVAGGLTFDLVGLAPGRPAQSPEVVHRYGCELDMPWSELEAVGLVAGPHLAAGRHLLPVVQQQAGLAAEFARLLPGVRVLCWTPARTAMASQPFVRLAAAWLEGGAFPALALLGFAVQDGALRSEGLAFFCGYELELDPSLSADPAEATRLAIRVAHELVGAEIPVEAVEFRGAEAQPLVMETDPGARSVRIRPM